MSSTQNIADIAPPSATQYPNIEGSRGIHLDYSPMTYEDQRYQVSIAEQFGRSTISLSPVRERGEPVSDSQGAAECLSPSVENPKRIGFFDAIVNLFRMMRRSIGGHSTRHYQK